MCWHTCTSQADCEKRAGIMYESPLLKVLEWRRYNQILFGIASTLPTLDFFSSCYLFIYFCLRFCWIVLAVQSDDIHLSHISWCSKTFSPINPHIQLKRNSIKMFANSVMLFFLITQFSAVIVSHHWMRAVARYICRSPQDILLD